MAAAAARQVRRRGAARRPAKYAAAGRAAGVPRARPGGRSDGRLGEDRLARRCVGLCVRRRRQRVDRCRTEFRNLAVGGLAAAGSRPDALHVRAGLLRGLARVMKILILNWRDIRSPRAGGAELLTHEIAAAWSQRGDQVTLFTSRGAGAPAREEIDGVHVVRRGSELTTRFFAPRSLGRQSWDVIVEEINTLPYFSPLWSRAARFFSSRSWPERSGGTKRPFRSLRSATHRSRSTSLPTGTQRQSRFPTPRSQTFNGSVFVLRST